jgi:hypothetical protein
MAENALVLGTIKDDFSFEESSGGLISLVSLAVRLVAAGGLQTADHPTTSLQA